MSTSDNSAVETVKVSVRSLYKIFGDSPQEILPQVIAGMGKSELLDKHNHVLALKDINIDMKAGEVTVIMGLSGSGKSTLIRHLNRLIEPTSGNIVVSGKDVMQLDKSGLQELRRYEMSMVFQRFGLFPHRSVLDNVVLSRRVRGNVEAGYADARRWIERVGLQGFEENYPSELSGGMQQRVGLARALTSDSDIMLMDEAFSALDPLIRTHMQDLLIELQQDLHKTIIFITHDLDESLKLADHLVILKDGEIVQQGDPQHIVLHPKDPYIKDFVSEINRARVIRAYSVMQPLPSEVPSDIAHISGETTLEDIISLSEGEVDKSYLITKDGAPAGILHMKNLLKALVPHVDSENESDARQHF